MSRGIRRMGRALMPNRAPRPCRRPGCFQLQVGESSYCADHQQEQRPAWQRTQVPTRIRGAKLQSLRRRLFAREPLCRECVKQGRTTAATIRDHIIPLAEGGQDVESNTQPLCQRCSDEKTARESRRGRLRSIAEPKGDRDVLRARPETVPEGFRASGRAKDSRFVLKRGRL